MVRPVNQRIPIDIVSGTYVSAPIEIDHGRVVGVITPTSFTASDLNFHVGVMENSAYPLYNADGTALAGVEAAPNRAYQVPTQVEPFRYLYLVANSTGVGIVRTATETFQVIVKD